MATELIHSVKSRTSSNSEFQRTESETINSGSSSSYSSSSDVDSLKSSVVNSHVKSQKHAKSKERLLKKSVAEKDIAMSLNASENMRGETLPEDQRVYRFKVVRVFLRTATPLNRLTHFRGLLEENALRLSDRRQMSDIIPSVLAHEHQTLKQEISDKYLSVIFDGTTRLGEALVIIVRFINSKWEVKERLICFKSLAKSLTGEETARVLIDTVSRQYGVESDFVIACVRDRCSSNNVAVRTLKIIFPNLLDVGCFSHTLDLCGDKIKATNLHDFMLSWLCLFSHSPKAKLIWKEMVGVSIRSYCPTRWWSKLECMKQVLELYADVHKFLLIDEEFSSATRSKCLSFFRDPQKAALLKLELANVVDFAQPFVKATYN